LWIPLVVSRSRRQMAMKVLTLKLWGLAFLKSQKLRLRARPEIPAKN
jgi:hypothetical protein